MKSNEAEDGLSIGEVAGRFGLATHVLRHWESVGLLSPVRVEAGRRRYGRPDLYRIAAVLRAKEAGLSLEDIRRMLAEPDLDTRRTVLRRHRDELARRIEQARLSLELIDCALECGHQDLATCPDVEALLETNVTACQGRPCR